MQNFSFFAKKYVNQDISSLSASLFLSAMLAVLGGCGSGSENPGTSTTTTGTTTTTTPGTTTTTTTPTPTITLALTNAAGATVTSISTGANATVSATLKDAAGAVVPNAVVTFSTDAALATITPAATALTSAAGVATVTLSSASLAAAGATTITATSQVGTAAVTGSIGYAVGASAVTISAPVLGVGAAPLSAFGTTSISVTVASGGVAVTTPQNVTFSSACASSGKAILTASVATVAGVATGSYRDNGCAGTDTITASAAGVISVATSLVVTPPTTGSIQFISATPSTLSLKGTGGTESSQVTFKVVDTGGNPISGKTVTFGLSTTVGGIVLTPVSGTATSDAAGLVVTNVNSGTVSTPVRVTASTPGATAGTTLTTQSSGLTVTTGIPDQDSFSLVATLLNPEFRNIDGNTTVLTARLADHFNNPVPDGTVVNFTTEGGSIVASCSTAGGACSSTLTSQAPRPANGRVTVLAYAVGEETFIDLNGNGVADRVLPLVAPNELLDINGVSTDLPEAFRDDNENGVRDAGETFIDFNQNGAYDVADSQFNGVLCDAALSSPGTCSTTKSIHVRRSLAIVFSGSDAVMSLVSPAAGINLVGCTGGGATGTYQVDLRIVDVVGNPMPVGSTIAVTTTNGTIVAPSNFIQANTNTTPAAGAATHSVFIKDESVAVAAVPPAAATCSDANPSGLLTVTVTTPGGATQGTTTIGRFNVAN